MAINSKKKGNRNERKLTKLWETWTGWEFQRVPASGGLRWKKTDDITGDIICTEPGITGFKFSVETKSHKTIDFAHLLNGNKRCSIMDFWNQTLADSERAKRIPILFMRSNGMKQDMYFVAIDMITYNKVRKLLKNKFGRLRFNNQFVILNSIDLFNSNFSSIYQLL